MNINLIAVGDNMPDWVNTATALYQKRFPPEITLNLIELPAAKRTKNTTAAQLQEKEAAKIIKFLDKNPGHTIALEVTGKALSTEQLATHLQTWRDNYQTVNLLIGGPDGLAEIVRTRSQTLWSLSKLTLPHPLVRVLLTEQLYRAWTLLINHPYHRS